jgi:UDPglucose 6-dehydrogenase
LEKTARDLGYDAQVLRAVETVNQRQKERLFTKISGYFNGDLSGRTVALWGLSFKPNTDDMREASSRTLMESLWGAGARVQAYDPAALEEARRLYGERDDLVLVDEAMAALDGADTLAIVTEWSQFRSPRFEEIGSRLKHPVIFDGRNIMDARLANAAGLTYISIGRAPSRPE